MAFGDANYTHNENRHCFFYYNCAVTTAREFASGHLETEAKSVNMDLEPQVATGLDLRNGAGGGYNFPPPVASPTSRDPSGHPPRLSSSTLTPNCVCPRHWAVRGHTDPGTPLLKGDPERMGVRLWSEVGSEEARHWSAVSSREGRLRRGGHWGKVPPVQAGTRGAEP